MYGQAITSHVFRMQPTGSAASSSHGIGPPGLAIQDGQPIAIDDMPQQQLQRSAVQLQSPIEQLQIENEQPEMAQLQHQ